MPANCEAPARLLRPDEAAERLNVRLHRLYQLVREGTVPAVRLGSRQIRIRPDALEEFIASGGSQPGTEA
jgi:excisionase family DNA binding protein